MTPGSATAEFKPLELEEVSPEQEMFRDKEETANILFMAKELKQLKGDIQELEAKVKEMKADFNNQALTLYELMIKENLKLNIDKVSIYPQLEYWVSIPKENRTAAFAQLKTLGMGDYIHDDVNVKTLSADFREMIDRGEVKEIEEPTGDKVWKFMDGPCKGMCVAMKISGKKKINMRKG